MAACLAAGTLALSACTQQAAPTPVLTSTATPAAKASPTVSKTPKTTPTPTKSAVKTTPTPAATPTPEGTPTPEPTPVPPTAAFAPAVGRVLKALQPYRDAIQTGMSVDAQLGRQRTLVLAMDSALKDLAADESAQAQAARVGLETLRDGLADPDNLASVAAALQGTLGGGTTMPSGTTPSAVPLVDLGGITDSLDAGLRQFRQALDKKDARAALQVQAELLELVASGNQAVQADSSQQAGLLRAALSDLQLGLKGQKERLVWAAEKLALARGDAPASAITGAAASLLKNVEALRAAAATGNQADLLRLQQQILPTIEKEAQALQYDESAAGKAYRAALAALRKGVAGDMVQLEAGRTALTKIAGVTTDAAEAPATDLLGVAQSLDLKVAAFQAALAGGDTGTILKTQQELLQETQAAKEAATGISTKPGEMMRSALEALRGALDAGDLNKLKEARQALAGIIGANVPSGAQPGAAQPIELSAILRPIANEVRNKLSGLRDALKDGHRPESDIVALRLSLKDEVAKDQQALANAQDPASAAVREAISTARAVAEGDNAKVGAAMQQLDKLLGA